MYLKIQTDELELVVKADSTKSEWELAELVLKYLLKKVEKEE